MYRTDEIAVALTAAWVRNGVANKEPKEIADFYRIVYDALEEVKAKDASKVEGQKGKINIDTLVQVTSVGILILMATIAILASMYIE
jgi:hypothetical protein